MAMFPTGAGADDLPVGATGQDEQIARSVQRTLMNNMQLEKNPIRVAACEGDVLLTGTLPDADLREYAGELAVSVDGVKNVINNVEVSGQRS